MKTLEIELPDALAARLEELVGEGWFASDAEIVRLALAEFLQRRPFELQERFQREDIAWAVGRTDGNRHPVRRRQAGTVQGPRTPAIAMYDARGERIGGGGGGGGGALGGSELVAVALLGLALVFGRGRSTAQR